LARTEALDRTAIAALLEKYDVTLLGPPLTARLNIANKSAIRVSSRPLLRPWVERNCGEDAAA
jgi:hypothetical protein